MPHEKTVIKFLVVTFAASFCSLSFMPVPNQNDCTSPDIERNDPCLVSRPLKEAIFKLKIDTSRFFAFDEPPGVLRGIYIHQSDTCMIRLYVERTSIIDKLDSFADWRMKYLYIIDKNIIGVTGKKPKIKKARAVGFRIPYWH